jgi:hypothetical protein
MYILTPLGGLEEYAAGDHTTIWRLPGSVETWGTAVGQVKTQIREAQEAQLIARLGLLADTGKLRAPRMMNHEGDNIYAVKTTKGLRAYGWFTQVQDKRAFVISHVILKKTDKLDPADRARAIQSRDATTQSLRSTNGRH